MTNQTWKVPTLSLKNPISIPHFDPSIFYYVQDSWTTTLLCQWYEIWPFLSVIHLRCMKKQQPSLSLSSVYVVWNCSSTIF
ncbi:hypothetical protein AMTRI_Chr06g196900 [Amborella trichopoda]